MRNYTQEDIDFFLKKAMQKMYEMAGYDPPSSFPEKKSTWGSGQRWDKKTADEFRRWFISQSINEIGWSIGMAKVECAYFDLMYGFSELPEEYIRKGGGK